jgi:riboflavin synthase
LSGERLDCGTAPIVNLKTTCSSVVHGLAAMFTGLVSDIGEVIAVMPRGLLWRARIGCAFPADLIAIGASIACAGPCLTVVERTTANGRTIFDVDVGAETLARTTLARWRPGSLVNLERSLKLGDELGGHLVTGHIDGMGEVTARRDFDGMAEVSLSVPPRLAKFIAEKGSVCLDGTSLTVNAVDGDRFSVLIIPHTLAATTWAAARVGDAVNVEVDLMARYAARLLQTAASPR